MNRFWLGILGLAGQTIVAQAADPYIPIYPLSGSIAPYVDKDGYANPLISLGAVKLWDSMTLPLVLNYSSAIRSPSPEFGQGWDCPLFDAKIYDVQKNLKKVEMLGGKELYLIYNPRTDTWKHFFTDAWKGEAKSENVFTLTCVTGCQLIFKNGLISSMVTPNGRIITWTRMGDKLVSMEEEGKPPAMQIVYDKLGFAKQILLNPDAMGKSKNVYDLSSDLVYAGINNIRCPNGRVIAFDRTRDKSLNPILKWTDSMHLPITLSWDKKTGKFLSDDKYTYQFTEVEPDSTWPKMFRKNKVTGKTESYYFDENHGITDETLPDGTLRHIEMIQAPGPNYKAVRLIQDTKNGKTCIVLRRAFDDQGHLLQEAFGLANGKEQLKQYVYDDVGHVVSFLLNGKEMWKNVYDPVTGQLKERDLPDIGIKMAFEQLPGGDVKESIIKAGGEVTSTKTLAPTDWQANVKSMQRIE